MIRRTALALAAALTVPLTWLAEPAAACSCPIPQPTEEVRAGHTIAVLTVVARRNFEVTYQVETSNRPLPDRIVESEGDGCDLGGSIGQTLAVTMRGDEDASWGWDNYCRQMEVGATLTAVRGLPAATAGEPVAVVAGRFGGNRLAAVDAGGRVVAWKKSDGTTDGAAICPGGTRMATIGFDRSPGPAAVELTVLDTRTLATRRTVVLSTKEFGSPSRPRCLDADGSRVQFFGAGGVPKTTGLFEVRGDQVRRVADLSIRLDSHLQALAGDGYGTRAGSRGSEYVAHVDATGAVRKLAPLRMLEGIGDLAVDPSGTTVAVLGRDRAEPVGPGYDENLGRQIVVTLDLRDGRVLASWTPDRSADRIAWDSAGRLAVRVGHRNRFEEFTPGVVHLLDRDLRPIGTRPAPLGLRLTVVGDTVVGYGSSGYGGGTRPVLSAPTGPSRSLDDLWLAMAEEILPLGPTGFAADAGDTRRLAALRVSTSGAGSTDDSLPLVLCGLAVTVLGMGLGAARGRSA
ncbi:MAG: hypothetical protein ACT4QF_03695 [Sporichthyaceae bacterium]